MSLFFMLRPSGIKYVVTITGETIIDSDSVGPVSAGILFNTDGTVDQVVGGSPSQSNPTTDWVIPNGATSSKTFHAKAEQVSQTGGGTLGGDLSSWKQITGVGGSNYQWDIERLSGSGTSTWVIDVSISNDGGSTTIATGQFDLQATIV